MGGGQRAGAGPAAGQAGHPRRGAPATPLTRPVTGVVRLDAAGAAAATGAPEGAAKAGAADAAKIAPAASGAMDKAAIRLYVVPIMFRTLLRQLSPPADIGVLAP